MVEERSRARTDVAFVLAVSSAYVVAEAAGVPKLWTYVAFAISFSAFAVHVWRRGGESWSDFGLGRTDWRRGLLPIGGSTATAAAAIVGYAMATDAPLWRNDMTLLLPLYPVFGITQQFAFQGVLHRRLLELQLSRPVALVMTAVAFSLVHVGDTVLVALTLAAGLAWSTLYQRWPSVWLLGLSHGVLASLAYPILIGTRPLERI